MNIFSPSILPQIVRLTLSGSVLAFCLLSASAGAASMPPGIREALGKAGTNRSQILNALQKVPAAQRHGLEFLIANMPDQDLKTLSAEFLLQNVSLAYTAIDSAPWKASIPADVFLNDIVPYACLNEARDGARAMLREKSEPLIAGARTPGEAAQRINAKLFPLVGVKYSTGRHKPDQAPTETIASGKATCSGLSILLADACRSVGIPARVVGTPLWSDGSGNHTWVEVWDGGWHFVGAAEPDEQGLDHAWFLHNASLAKADVPANAIYASSFAKTKLAFPLIWAPEIDWVPAVNVTSRYAAAAPAVTAGVTRLLVKVIGMNDKRIATRLTVRDIADGSKHWEGMSTSETADMRNLSAFQLPQGRVYEIAAGRYARQTFASGTAEQAVVTLQIKPVQFSSTSTFAAISHLQAPLAAYFAASAAQQAAWKFPAAMNEVLLRDEPGVRAAAWDAFRAAPIHEAMHQDFGADQVTFGQYRSIYTIRTVGARPANGWPLLIAMHGGGGAPKEVNDSQWKIMQIYYKDHPEQGGYKYLALRAPNDTWNGFYDVYVYPLVANLITQFRLFGDIDPNKVFLAGYSHGGYGAFAIGPKEPDLFAAIHAAAGAPTDGETTAKTLRTTEFTCMVGDQDTMYDRIVRDRKFADELSALRGDRHDIYPVYVEVKAGFGHPNLPDRDKIADFYPAVRNPVPREVTWLMTDDVIHDLFWLHTDAPAKNLEIDATCQDNVVTVTTKDTSASVLLDSRLIDFHKPVILVLNGVRSKHKLTPDLRTLCSTLLRRGDPNLAWTASLPLVPNR